VPDLNVVGSLLEQSAQHGVAGQTEDVIDSVGFTSRHHLGAAIMAIAADRQTPGRPVTADPAHQTPHMAADLVARRRLAGPQQDGDRA